MKKYLSMFLAILMLVSLIPVMALAEDAGDESSTDEVSTLANQGNESFDDHIFGHLDVRIAGATFNLKHIIKDASGNVITIATEQVTASVTAVHSVTINGQKYDEFVKDKKDYEFRQENNVSIQGKDITDLTKAVIVVDLVDSNGKTYSNVKFTLNKSLIEKAATDCDGYMKGKYDGLDFILTGGLKEDEVSATVTSTGISFEVTKNLDGQLCTEADLFTFDLYQGETLVTSATNDATGKATLVVSYANLASYEDITYTIKERVDSTKTDTYEYDDTVYTIVVGFKEAEADESGNYVRTPYVKDGGVSSVVFNNTTKATPAASESTEPSDTPAASESAEPSDTPAAPTATPAPTPTESTDPSEEPTTEPTQEPTSEPTQEPTPEPEITPEPTQEPTPEPEITPEPSTEPSDSPEPTKDPNETVTIGIPVQKVVEMTGKYLPSTDTAFNFRLTLSNKEMGTDKIVAKIGDAVINGGQFSITVKAGETTASGNLYISGPRSQMANLTGTIQEIVPETTGKWTYDTRTYSFILNEDGGFDTFGYLNTDDGVTKADKAAFTNQFLENVPRTTLTVKKVWQDKGYEKKRPDSVTVELYYYQKDKDGKDTKTKVLYKVNGKSITAELNADNNWAYTFENLDARWTWTVDEVKTPSGYSRKVTLSSDKKTATVTNTYGAQPKTGFDGLPLILCMVAVMLAGGVALVVINRKKSSRKSR